MHSSDEIYLMAAINDDGIQRLRSMTTWLYYSVIVNRVKSGRWGNSITDVIYADGVSRRHIRPSG